MTLATASYEALFMPKRSEVYQPNSNPTPSARPQPSGSGLSGLTSLTEPATTAANTTVNLVKWAVFAVSVAAAIPTAQNLYYSWKHDVPFTQVSHRLQQYDLWMKNLDCKIDYRALSTAGGTKVDVGSCSKSGDIAIKVTSNGKATYEWIAYDALQKPGVTSASLINLFIAQAHADESVIDLDNPKSQNQTRMAQADMQVVCQAKVKDEIVRIVKEGNKCFRETVSPFKGSVDKREEVACDTQCS
jgi:hypothetical protein